MTTYVEDRARRIVEGPTGRANYNGRFSRQQRRANAREAEKEPILSNGLIRKLATMQPGDGLFITRAELTGFRTYQVAPAHTKRKPSADYTDRYKALFPVLPGA